MLLSHSYEKRKKDSKWVHPIYSSHTKYFLSIHQNVRCANVHWVYINKVLRQGISYPNTNFSLCISPPNERILIIIRQVWYKLFYKNGSLNLKHKFIGVKCKRQNHLAH